MVSLGEAVSIFLVVQRGVAMALGGSRGSNEGNAMALPGHMWMLGSLCKTVRVAGSCLFSCIEFSPCLGEETPSLWRGVGMWVWDSL